jgi:hypothetical protein
MCSQALYKKGTDSGVRHGCGRLLARAKHYGAQARRKWLLQASELHEGEDPARVSNHPDSIQNIKRALFLALQLEGITHGPPCHCSDLP